MCTRRARERSGCSLTRSVPRVVHYCDRAPVPPLAYTRARSSDPCANLSFPHEKQIRKSIGRATPLTHIFKHVTRKYRFIGGFYVNGRPTGDVSIISAITRLDWRVSLIARAGSDALPKFSCRGRVAQSQHVSRPDLVAQVVLRT